MKILHITSTFYQATFWGGPVFSTHALCNALAEFPDIELRVLTSDMAGPNVSDRLKPASFPVRFPAGYDVFYTRRILRHDLAPGLLVRIWKMTGWADIVLLTGVYTSPTIPTLLVCLLRGKPLIWSPRGSLQAAHEWQGARRQTTKKIWEAICKLVLPKKCILHVTSEVERKASVARMPGCEVVNIPNAVDVPEVLPKREWKRGGKLRLLFISRIDPKKGLENLIQAIPDLSNDTVLNIYGTGTANYMHSLEELVANLGLSERVLFHGHVDGQEKVNAFSNSDLLVLPSYSENFGMVIAEALAHGIPVIASYATPWSELEERGCGAWVSNDSVSLARAIERLRGLDLSEMGSKGRRWMLSDFRWESRGNDFHKLFSRLLNVE